MRSLFLLILMLIALPAQAKLSVVTTTADLAAVAREVAGDFATVQSMAAPNQDVHYVDARPNLTLTLNKADLLIINGMELEIGWLPALLQNARNTKITPGNRGYFDASSAIKPLQVHGSVDRSQGDIHAHGNPHFMHDPRAAADVALALGAVLAGLDSKNAADYRLNAARTAEGYRNFAKAERERFDTLKIRSDVVVYHDSLVYLVDWLGLIQVTTIEPRPGIPPNPGHVSTVLKAIREKNVHAILQEEYYPRKTSETLAQMAKIPVVLIPGGARNDETYLDRARKTSGPLYDVFNKTLKNASTR